MTSPATPATSTRMMRRGAGLLAEMIRTHPRPFIGALSGAIIFSVAAVAGAIALGRITDDLLIDPDGGTPSVRAVVGAGVVLLVIAVGRAVGVVGRRYFGVMAARSMQRTWFDRLSDHYLDQPLHFFQGRPAGELLAHADSDTERAVFSMQALPLSVGAIVLVVFSSISLAVLDPMLLAIGLALFPALLLTNRLYTVRVEGPSARAQALVGKVSAVAHESFEGALVVKLLGVEAVESKRMGAAADELRNERLIIGRLRAAFEPTIDTLPLLGTVALLAVGAWRVDAGAITTGDLVQAMTLFGILGFPMRVVGFLLEEIPRSVVSRDRLVDVLSDDKTPEHGVPNLARTPDALPQGPLSISASGLRFRYGDDAVIDGVDLDIGPGEIVALVGPTGSGKSTLLHLLAGLVRPEDGSVTVGGVSLPNADPGALRDAVSLVFQETFLFAGSVHENLVLHDDSAGEDQVRNALSVAQADFVLDLPRGLDTAVGERGITLSGGQRQRVAIARALLRNPRLLLLDDATSAVDPTVERRILDRLRGDLQTTTIVVAHRVATISLADRVIFFDGGKVVADGAHDELLAIVPAYRALMRAYENERAGEVGS